jgi:3-methyl-2-oxobutanoate hydroxymethyltransferase
MDNTLGVSVDMMIAHGKAVRRGLTRPVLVVDMPYGSYEDSDALALQNARRIIQETGCDAVKLEGGQPMASRIKTLTAHDIPVMAHIGLLPQSVEKEGGYKIKGRTPEDMLRLIADAKAVEDAGAFCFVLEGTAHEAAAQVSAAVSIPSIGIGASLACDGQILVTEDMLGLSGGYLPKFVKLYEDMGKPIESVIRIYAEEVRGRKFPAKENLYS